MLDGDIVVDGATTYLYYKNLTRREPLRRPLLHGPPNSFTTYTSGIRIGNAIEAPLLQKTNDGGWRLWGDSFSPVNNDYYLWSSSNIGANAVDGGEPARLHPAAERQARVHRRDHRRRSTTPWSPGGACPTGCG
ncbi:hypothetical protein [Streptosporangium vulgare]|uniref:hypothetical protein n=1 Tax=Streptosporangium vulgare TaxID=46190 RepID=UPI0031DDCF42